MISIHLMGGLGNQFFQIFTLFNYALKYNKDIKIEYSETLNIGTIRPTYWNTLFKHIKYLTTNNSINLPLLRENGFHFTELPMNIDNIKLTGYFQSEKYFKEYYDKITEILKLNEIKTDIKDKYNQYLKDNNTISMHFRLGDNKPIHKQKLFPILNKSYHINSLKYISNTTNNYNWNVLYFCEKEDNDIVIKDIEYMKTIEKFKNINFIKVSDNISEWEQLLLMSLCKHNIIANSTFSWWGAYLNDNNNKIVCYPNLWFGKDMNITNLNDLFPNNWIKINEL